MSCTNCSVKKECVSATGLDLSTCDGFRDYMEPVKVTILREYTVWLTKRTNLPTCLLTEYIEEVLNELL